MDAAFEVWAKRFGASPDQVKLIFCLLVSYPLGNVYVRLPRSKPVFKHLFNVGVSFFYLVGVFHLYLSSAQLLASAVLTWYVAKRVQGPNMPWIVFSFVMASLLGNHIYRTIYAIGSDKFEITGPQMVLTLKLTSFAWHVWDGRRPAKDLDKSQMATRITEFPSLLAFLGYAFYFSAVLVGHSSDYATYVSLVDGTLFLEKTPPSSDADSDQVVPPRRVPRGRKRVAYRKAFWGLFFLGTYMLWNGLFDYELALTQWWLTRSFKFRLIFFQIIGFIQRTKYYAVWLLTEGACIVSGLGFSGYTEDGKTRWEGVANIDIRAIEWPSNFKTLLDAWNIKTNVWLRECVYKRVTPAGKKPGFRSSMLTFLTSAIWHGIYSGYYLTFVLAGFLQTAGRLARSYIRPFFLPPLLLLPPARLAKLHLPPPPPTILKRIYDLIGTLLTLVILNYCAAPFLLLHWRPSIEAWSNMDWYGHIIIFAPLLFFQLGGRRVLSRMKDARVKKAEAMEFAANEAQPKKDVQDVHIASPEFARGAGGLAVPPLDEIAQEVEKLEKVD